LFSQSLSPFSDPPGAALAYFDQKLAIMLLTYRGEPIVHGPNRDRAISKFVEVARPD